MGDLGTALELLRCAPGSFRTIDAAVRQWCDPDPLRREIARPGVSPKRPYAVPDWAVYEVRKRLRLEVPHRLRLEQVVSVGPDYRADPSLLVVDGDNWWMQSQMWGARADTGIADSWINTRRFTTTGVEDLLDPSDIPNWMDLEVVGRSMQAGRPVLVLRAERQSSLGPPNIGVRGTVEHELAVDLERGVALKIVRRFEGAVVAVTEVLEIAFDEPIPRRLFSFDAPDDQPLPPMPRRFSVSIEEAVERAPFAVFVLGDIPDDWTICSISYTTESRHPPGRPVVTMFYGPPRERWYDGPLCQPLLMEQTTRPRGADGPAPTLVERYGQEFWLSAGLSGWGTRIECSRSGTTVSLECHLPEETLVDLAASLVPAPRTPPRLVEVLPPDVAFLPPAGGRQGTGPPAEGDERA